MKNYFRSLSAALLLAGLLGAAQANDEERAEGQRIVASMPTEARRLCVFDGGAPSDMAFEVVRKLKVAKGSYGGVKQLLPEFAQQALRNRADAIIDYNSSQRFGFWPWRVVRPVVTGTAIRWRVQPAKSCAEMGGVLIEEILLLNQSPEAMAKQMPQTAATAPNPAASSASE